MHVNSAPSREQTRPGIERQSTTAAAGSERCLVGARSPARGGTVQLTPNGRDDLEMYNLEERPQSWSEPGLFEESKTMGQGSAGGRRRSRS